MVDAWTVAYMAWAILWTLLFVVTVYGIIAAKAVTSAHPYYVTPEEALEDMYAAATMMLRMMLAYALLAAVALSAWMLWAEYALGAW